MNDLFEAGSAEVSLSNLDSSVSATVSEKVMTVLRNIRAHQSNGLPYGNRTNLSDAGFTSMEMVQVMLGVESAFDLMIPQRYITPENFATVASITGMICELTGVNR